MKRLSYFLTLFFSLSALPAQAATLTATKTVSGQFAQGSIATYTIVISNSGTAQGDNPGDEFTDIIPSGLFNVTASATSGTAVLNFGFPPTVTWNGTIGAGASVTITINATIGLGIGASFSNQGTVNFDSDGNGTNESSVQTDDPSQPGPSDPTVFAVENKGAGSARPAATLLLPYFEVDPIPNFPAASAPLNTVLTVGNGNVNLAAVLTRVTVWTDYGLPTLSFHLYLTGNDIETIDLRQLFDGVLPRSADAGDDPFDNISNKGFLSQDINYPCNEIFNATRPPSVDIVGLRRAHSGLSSSLFGNQCASRNHGDGVLRGYITIDAITSCDDTLLPNDPGYETLLTNQNLLWGSYSITDSSNNYSDSGTLVHLKSGPPVVPGKPTFYQRFNGDTTREALGSVWGARYLNGGAFSDGTALRVWREPRTQPTPVACATTNPSFLPGRQVQIVAFDEQENPIIPGVGGQFAQPFPLVTQQVRANGATLPLPSSFGWLYLDLNYNNPLQAAQSYVSVAHSAAGRYRVSNGAVMIQSGLAQNLPLGASLRATKAVTGQFGAGGTVTYTVAIENQGAATQQNNPGAEFTDVLPAQLTLVSATATSGVATATVATNTVTWNGGLAIGAKTTVTITATVKTPLAVGTVVSNQGQVSCDGDANGTNDPCGFTDDPITGQPNDPTIFLVGGGNRALVNGTKTVIGAPFLVGGAVVYTVVLTNVGTGTFLNDAGGDEFFDSLSSLLTFQSATTTGGTVTNSGNQVRWNGTLAPNATVTLKIRALINSGVPSGRTIGNQGSMRYDANGDGVIETFNKRTDDPNTPDVDDSTVFTVGP